MVVLSVDESADGWELICGRLPSQSDRAHAIHPSHASFGQGPVLIFTSAADPDALAAVRTLTALLKADLVRYEVHPVAGYSQLRDKFNVLVRGDAAVDPLAVLCINCGATVDLETILAINSHSSEQQSNISPHLRVFVIDSHRPFHLKNVHSNQVVIFSDQDSFTHGTLPITLGIEDEWGVVPDSDSSADEQDDESIEDDQDDESIEEHQSHGSIEDDQQFDHANDHSESVAPVLSDQEDIDETKHSQPGHSLHKPPSKEQDSASEKQLHNEPSESPVKKQTSTKGQKVDNNSANDIAGDTDASDSDDGHIRRGTRKRRIHQNEASQNRRRKKTAHRAHRRTRTLIASNPESEERKRLREYYSSATVALSSACLSHRIADALKRASIDTLWMAIIGATTQHFTGALSEQALNESLTPYRGQVQLLNDAANNGVKEDSHTSAARQGGRTTACRNGSMNRIAESDELRLDLLRHWTLYHSLLYSSYTATRLASWRQAGKRRLLEMLATLGIPLHDSQQGWCYMKQRHKMALDSHLPKAIARFDLGSGIEFKSFVRSLPGHKGDISAPDFVYAITSILELDDPVDRYRQGNNSDSLVLDRFWRAYDALDPRKTSLLETGLDMAISAQRLTAEIGGDVIERRKFVPSGPFRYVFLRDQQFKEFLSNPLLLRRLALFLKTALFRQGARDKPFIILAPDTTRRIWIAVSATTYGQKNDFGYRFMKAAEQNGSQVTYDGFDSSVCEIPDGQEIEFVRYLHDVMR